MQRQVTLTQPVMYYGEYIIENICKDKLDKLNL